MIFPDSDSKISLFIRHAERFQIKKMSEALELLITENGRQEAYSLGKSLTRFSPFEIYYSPVERCRQTAEAIHTGLMSMNDSSQIIDSKFDLGGPYIRGNWQEVAEMVERMGQEEFIRRWFNNELSDQMIVPLEEAAMTQMRIITDQLMNSDKSSINITHDWNVMLLREYFLNLKHEEIGQPAFLDGIIAYCKNDSIILSSMNEKRTIQYALNQPIRNH